MTKTVCDICGKHEGLMRHCSVPMYRKYTMEKQGIKLGEFTQAETVEIDLCNEHWLAIADFIELMKENTNVL